MKTKSIVMFLGLVSLLFMGATAQEGRWIGQLDVQGTKLPLVFNFDADGCTVDSPLQGAIGLKAEKTFNEQGKMMVSVPTIGGLFEGFYLKNIINGTFTQGPASLPLTLTRLNRPQTPCAPFPYSTEEVTFKNGQFVFNGTLTLPAGFTKDTPAVVMVTGSGQQNRDEELMYHKPYSVIADALARQGIASLRYDDRGFGDSQVQFYNYSTYDFMDDAKVAIDVLRKRFKKVGVLGHSEGGTIALMLASEGKTDFIISMAGMAIPAPQQMVIQNRDQLTVGGFQAEDVETYCKALEEIFALLTSGKDTDAFVVPQMPDALAQNFREALKQWKTIPYFTRFLTLDAGKNLAKIKCPVLALNGTKDLQVACEANLSLIDKGVASPHEVVAFESMNHLFQHCTTGALTEYLQIEQTIAPEVLKKITQWINGNY